MLSKIPFILSGLFLSLDFFSKGFNNILICFGLFFLLLFFQNKNSYFFSSFMKNLENSIPMEKILNLKNFLLFIFLLIFSINFLSLFPHIFSLFSMMNFTLILSLSFWSSMFLTNIIYFLKSFLIHLTPISTPLPLMSFMVVIELISQLIRPLTLLVRLGTNLTTGHLILGLISFFSLVSFFSKIPFFLLEMMVALVQSYVFTLLVILYFNE